MKLLVLFCGFLVVVGANGFIFDNLFAFPSTRRGRATPAASISRTEREPESEEKNPLLESISISQSTSQDDDIVKKLMQSVLQQVSGGASGFISDDEAPVSALLKEEPQLFEAEVFEEASPVIQLQNNGRPQSPRRVEEMKKFGERVGASDDLLFHDSLPQLASRDDAFHSNGAPDVMNLRSETFLRQNDDQGAAAATATASDDEDEIRCVPKVMQIEETVYDREIKSHHSFQEKCHMTYITDYKSSTQEKCETTFKKNCHITFKAMPFNETVNICHTPIIRRCSNESYGPDICSTHYETNCETRYKTYEVEQDEPVCRMELMKKCQDVTIPLGSRQARQFQLASADNNNDANNDADQNNDAAQNNDADQNNNNADYDDDTEAEATTEASNGAAVTVDQQCEEWPVQKCTLEKKTVKKVHPETECRKIPRQVCIPNNCQMVQGEEICRDEDKVQIQNVPQEECELQPEENCHAEAVLVPRLVPKPNCVKVPKEICVNTKSNPRRVKKPVVKQWCYNPKDLKDLKASNIVPNEVSQANLPGETARTSIFSRISKLLFSKK